MLLGPGPLRAEAQRQGGCGYWSHAAPPLPEPLTTPRTIPASCYDSVAAAAAPADCAPGSVSAAGQDDTAKAKVAQLAAGMP